MPPRHSDPEPTIALIVMSALVLGIVVGVVLGLLS